MPIRHSIADAAFCFAFSVFLASARRDIAGAGLGAAEPLAEGGLFATGPSGGAVVDPGVAYLGDAVVCAEAAEPRLIPDQVRQIAGIECAAASRSLFRVSIRSGKTDALVALHGDGAIAAWHLLEGMAHVVDDQPAVRVIVLAGGQLLRLVQQYKHLDVLLAATGALVGQS